MLFYLISMLLYLNYSTIVGIYMVTCLTAQNMNNFKSYHIVQII
jgi:hypothetical protein